MQYSADFLVGANLADGRGNVVLGIGYGNHNELFTTDRKIAELPISSVNGLCNGSTGAAPAIFQSGLQSPTNLNGLPTTGLGAVIDPTTGTFRAATQNDLYNTNIGTYFLTPLERINVYAAGRYEISDSVEFYTTAQFARNKARLALAASRTFGNANYMPLNNPFLLAAERLRWQLGARASYRVSLERVLAANPGVRDLWLTLVLSLIAVEDYVGAAEAIRRAIAALRDDRAFLLLYAHCASECGDIATADLAFARVDDRSHPEFLEKFARHLLRSGRPDAAARLIEPALGRVGDAALWPYASLGWRLTEDPRAEWLEGDPALVGVQELDPSVLDSVAELLRDLHRTKSAPAGQSVRGGTQTDGPLFAHEAPEIRTLRSAIVAAVRDHIDRMGSPDTLHPTRRHIGKPFQFAGSWSVRLSGAGHHSSHIHPRGWISSALYIALPSPEQVGPEPNGWLQLGSPPVELGLDLPPRRLVEPKVGRLVLFPSTMWHGTHAIDAGERLSVAFDVAAFG